MRIPYCPPLNLLWCFLPDDGSPAMVIHRCYAREVWRERGFWARAGLLAGYFYWPLFNLSMMGWFTLRNGAAIKQRTTKGITRQLLEQCSLAIGPSILPVYYYMYELYIDEKREKADQYIFRYEVKGGIYTFLKQQLGHIGKQPITNKAAFAAYCARRGLPTVPILAIARNGKLRKAAGQERALPAIGLFIKPYNSKGGRGAERWDHLESNRYKRADGTILTRAQLRDRLINLSLRHAYIVQPCVTNHPEIADLSNGALSTVRIITCLDEHDRPEITHAVFKMAVGKNTTIDNVHAGGIAATVDLRTGELRPATDLGIDPRRGWCTRHPDTGAQISGRKLLFWTEALDLARRAHTPFSGRIVIGWDVALTTEGPLLVEGNGAPGVDLIQRPNGEPIGSSRLGELLAFHVRRALAERDRARSQLPLTGGVTRSGG